MAFSTSEGQTLRAGHYPLKEPFEICCNIMVGCKSRFNTSKGQIMWLSKSSNQIAMLLDRDWLALQRANLKFGPSALYIWLFSYPVCKLQSSVTQKARNIQATFKVLKVHRSRFDYQTQLVKRILLSIVLVIYNFTSGMSSTMSHTIFGIVAIL